MFERVANITLAASVLPALHVIRDASGRDQFAQLIAQSRRCVHDGLPPGNACRVVELVEVVPVGNAPARQRCLMVSATRSNMLPSPAC